MSLAGDGVSDELFFLLWAKNELPSSRPHPPRHSAPHRGQHHHHAEQLPGSTPWHLPQTVIYKASGPCAWYFTSAKTGKILKKSKHNLLSRCIEEEFTKQTLAGDIVAYYLTLPNAFQEDDKPTAASPSLSSSSEDTRAIDALDGGSMPSSSTTSANDDDARIEYLDRAGLHQFLFNRSKDCGLLQQFVEPQGPRNAVIRAIWSPNFCIAERRVNLRHIYDRRYGLYERAVTYEGPDHHSQATPLKGHALSTLVQTVCEELVQHVAEITFQKQRISRCVFNFKMDARGRLFFLWSSSIRLEDPSAVITASLPPSRPPSSPRAHARKKQQQQQQLHVQHTPSLGPPLPMPTRPTDRSDDLLLNLKSQLSLPPDMRLATSASHQHRSIPPYSFPQPLFSQECPSCHAKTAPERFHVVTYKMVGSLHEKSLALTRLARRATRPSPEEKEEEQGKKQEGGTEKGRKPVAAGKEEEKEELVPPLLRSMAVDDYQRRKHDPAFASKRVKVCEDCFLRHAEVACEHIVRQASSQHNASEVRRSKSKSSTVTRNAGGGQRD